MRQARRRRIRPRCRGLVEGGGIRSASGNGAGMGKKRPPKSASGGVAAAALVDAADGRDKQPCRNLPTGRRL
eukprot:9801942-Heterocapsa_arctica.AAC.1